MNRVYNDNCSAPTGKFGSGNNCHIYPDCLVGKLESKIMFCIRIYDEDFYI